MLGVSNHERENHEREKRENELFFKKTLEGLYHLELSVVIRSRLCQLSCIMGAKHELTTVFMLYGLQNGTIPRVLVSTAPTDRDAQSLGACVTASICSV